MKAHLKRLPSPKSWSIQRKGIVYITRPYPGKHSLSRGMSFVEFMKTLVSKSTTKKEVKTVSMKPFLGNFIQTRKGVLDSKKDQTVKMVTETVTL